MTITEVAIERLKAHAHLIRRVRDGSGHAVADAIDALLDDRDNWRSRAAERDAECERRFKAQHAAIERAEAADRIERYAKALREIESGRCLRDGVPMSECARAALTPQVTDE